MPWYCRKAFWLAVIGLAAVLTQHYAGLTLSDDTKAALLTLIQTLIEALSEQPLS
jgi:hypothetical protein